MPSLDDTPLKFGKYKGRTPEDVGDVDPSYIVWMFNTVHPVPCTKALAEACEGELREYEAEAFYAGYWNE